MSTAEHDCSVLRTQVRPFPLYPRTRPDLCLKTFSPELQQRKPSKGLESRKDKILYSLIVNIFLLPSNLMSVVLHKSIDIWWKYEIALRWLSRIYPFQFYDDKKSLFEKANAQFCWAKHSLSNHLTTKSLHYL